jgi:hypothetical protein
MVRVNLFGNEEHLRSELAIAFVDRDVVDGDHGLESEFDLRPDEKVFDRLQLGARLS